jgi:hypothetical protein
MRIIKIAIVMFFCVFLVNCATQGYSTNGQLLQSASDKTLVDDAVKQGKKLNSILFSDDAKVELSLILAELVQRHPEWMWDKIDERRADKGMSKFELLLTWGKPYSTNKNKNYWIYKLQDSKNKVKFSGDKVTAITNIFVKNTRTVFN